VRWGQLEKNQLKQKRRNDANWVLAAGFCERWPKAWRAGFAPVLGQLLIIEKNLPLTIQILAFVKVVLKTNYGKRKGI